MIQEYRKATAEALALSITCDYCNNDVSICECGQGSDEIYFYYPDKIGGDQRYVHEYWQPDKDANQQNMVEDLLIKQGHAITYNANSDEKSWIIRKPSKEGKGPYKIFIHANDKSKSTAFMKAFMEYYKPQ